MNKMTRLTALLLALMMILSTFATAETAYQVGDMTTDIWQGILENAEDELFYIDEGDSGKEVMPELPEKPEQGQFHPYTDATETVLTVIETGVTRQMTASGVAVLKNSQPGQWQINIGGSWVNIMGESGDDLWVTAAMMNGMTTADFRKALEPVDEETGAYTVFTQTATVEIVEAVPAAFKLMARADETNAETGEEEKDTEDDHLSLQAANPDLDKYYVVINYVFDDKSTSGGMAAANPYTAEVSTNKLSFSATVKHPTVRGYAPASAVMKNNPDVEATEDLPDGFVYSDENITITNVDLDGDVNIYVYYVPAENTFDVIYWEELVEYTIDAAGNDVKYAKVSEKEYTGITEAPVKNSYGDKTVEQWFATLHAPDGFRPLLYDEEIAIAADGSTKVNVYYQRLYYLMAFDLGGGYGVNPIYTKHGAEIGEVGTPTRPGYEFMGWTLDPDATEYKDGQTFDEIPELMPIGNSQYYAVWKIATEATVSIVFWGENPNDEGYSYLQTGEITTTPGVEYTYQHGNAVNMKCELEEHSHAAAGCQYTCGKEEHTTHTEDCIECAHTHSLSCYDTRPLYDLKEATPGQTINPTTGEGVYSYRASNQTHYYLYLNGKWYCYFGNITGNKSDTQSISDCEHRHTTECYGCELHTHTEVCYNCGLINHTHNNSCSGALAGLNTNLWTFVRSETATVSPDGSTTINVYYDRKPFTITFKATGNNGATLATITDKWGADIKTRFENTSKQHTFLWSMKTNGDSPWTSFLDVMPQENRTYYAKTTTSSNSQSATYLVQTLGKTAGVAANYETLYTVTVKYGSNLTVSVEEFVEIEGFTFNDPLSTNTGSNYNGAKFYYDRNTYNIEFYNPTELIKKVENIYYEASIDDQYFVPGNEWIPSKYEPGSVYFDGWYLNPECTGEEYVFENKTMPVAPKNGDTSLVLYAKWSPYLYDVRVYTTQEAAEQARADVAATGTTNVEHIYQWVDKSEHVKHGKPVSSAFTYSDPNQYDDKTNDFPKPTRPGYTFALWYYFAPDGTMQPFSFTATPITQDTFVFAVWDSDSIANYTIYYVLEDGQEGAVAEDYYLNEANWVTDPYVGRGLAGANVTERAKGGDQLYDGTDNATGNTDYREGYFPTSESHSFFLNVEDENTKNVWVFEYVWEDEMPYTVYYVTLEDPQNGLVKVTIDGVEYFQVAEPFTDPDNRKAVVTENYKPVSGNYVPDAFQKRLIITTGMEDKDRVIVFYYEKDESRTTLAINHWLVHADGSQNTLYDSVKRIVDLDPEFVETIQSMTIPYYTYDPSRTTRTNGNDAPVKIDNLTITINQGSEGVVVDLYYVENKVDIQYKAVCPDNPNATNFGSVTPETENGIGVVTGDLTGSTAAAGDYYEFAGWYSDEDCTAWLSNDAKYEPVRNEDGVYETATYYAKFEEKEVVLYYVAVGPEGVDQDGNPLPTTAGTVAPTGESVKVLTGDATGSEAKATTPTFKFVGWFKDAACSQPVDASWLGAYSVNGQTIDPQKIDHDSNANTADVHVAATYYAKFDWYVGSLSIEKEVTNGNGADLSADEFIFRVTFNDKESSFSYDVVNAATSAIVARNQTSTNEGEIKLKAGQKAIISDLVHATTYNVEEIGLEQQPWYVLESMANAEGTIVAGQVAEAKFTNAYQTGKLNIKKEVVGTTAPDDTFTFQLDLSKRCESYQYTKTAVDQTTTTGMVAPNGTITLKKGEFVTITGIPAGTSYNVTENVESIKDRYNTDSTGSTGTIEKAADVTAIFTNTYLYGNLTISKRIDPPSTTHRTEKFTFTLELSDKQNQYTYFITDDKGNVKDPVTFDNGVCTFELEENWTLTVKDVPVGTTYKVTETPVSGYAVYVSINHQANKVSTKVAEGTIQVGTVDTVNDVKFINVYGLGSLLVVKNVVGAHPDDTFTFNMDVRDKDGNVMTGIFPLLIKYDKTGEMTSLEDVDIGKTITFELENGWSALIAELPEGVKFTITEVADNAYTTYVNDNLVPTAEDEPYYGEQTNVIEGTIPTTGMHEIAYTNVYRYSTLKIEKTGMESGESAIFQVEAVSRYNSDKKTTFTVSVPNGKSVTISDLLIGSDYTITEIDSWSNRYDAKSASGTIAENGSVETIDNGDKNNQWLHDEDYVHNNFSKPGNYAN